MLEPNAIPNAANNSSDKSLFKGVRSSKFRHVFGNVAKKDRCYDNLKITKNAHDSNFCAVNPKVGFKDHLSYKPLTSVFQFVAICTESSGGGSFIVFPENKYGRIEVNAGRVTGHKGPILDLKWNPFNDNVIASCSDDCTIKLWYIPDEGLQQRNLNEPIVDLREHHRRVSYIEWHPTAENILVSTAFDYLLIVWNVSKGLPVQIVDCHPDVIHSISFNRDGSLLATTCKDKNLRIIDPRSGEVVKSGLCHRGSKASRVVFLGDSQRLFTTGFSRYSDRQWAVWSANDLSEPLTIENIDSSSGVLFPYYDNDTRMVYVAGKGDGNIRYYELTDEPPYCHYLSQFLTGFPQRGLGVMPKRGLDVYKCEVFRFYKLHATRPVCEPISMIVPRKSEQFQQDIFPDTAAPTPALSAEDWLSGKNRNPILFNLKTGSGAKTNKPVMFKSDRLLQTSDINNERKFVFISQENIVDYREKNGSDETNVSKNKINGMSAQKTTINGLKEQKAVINGEEEPKNNNRMKGEPNGTTIHTFTDKFLEKCNEPTPAVKKFPWIKDREPKKISINVCDIVTAKQMPTATYVTLADEDTAAEDVDCSPSPPLIIDENSVKSDDNNDMNDSNDCINDPKLNLNNNCINNSNIININNNLNNISNGIKDDSEQSFKQSNQSPPPKNERELWSAFHSQSATIHSLEQQLEAKDKRIKELEELLSRVSSGEPTDDRQHQNHHNYQNQHIY